MWSFIHVIYIHEKRQLSFEAVSVLRGGDGFNYGFNVLDGDSDGVLRMIRIRAECV